MTILVLSPGVTGYTLPDLNLRFYDEDFVSAADPGVALVDLGDGDYRLTGLTDGWHVTGEFPSGLWWAGPNPATTDSKVLIPLRVTSLTAAGIELSTYVNGIESTDTHSITEVGGTGDYTFAFTPVDGPRIVRWTYGGITYRWDWVGQGVPTAPATPGPKTIAKRLGAAYKIKNSGYAVVLTVERAIYSGGKKIGVSAQYTHALVDSHVPSQDRDLRNEDIVLVVSGLQCDVNGDILDTTPILIEHGDFVVWDSRRLPVIRPNAVEPQGVAILYDRLVAGVRKVA